MELADAAPDFSGSLNGDDARAYVPIIAVCNLCNAPDATDGSPRAGAFLAESTAEAAACLGILVRSVACLGNCKRGLSAVIMRSGAWSYVFGELTRDSAPALVSGALLLAKSSDGQMPYRERADVLKRGLVARIPPLTTVATS